MKYFGIFSLLLVLTIAIVWSVNGLGGGQYVNEDGEVKTTGYQDAIDSAHDAADSISAAGNLQIEIYDGISYAPETLVVDLAAQNLNGSLKAEIRKLSDLEVLDISDNDFTALPAEVGQLTKLKNLNISNNPLTGLPRELGQLQNLAVLDVSGIDYSVEDLTAIQQQLASTTVVITQ